MSEELKPCPFCGGPAYVGQWQMSTYWSIGCSNNGDDDCLFRPDSPNTFKSKKLAIEAWNKRSKKTPL